MADFSLGDTIMDVLELYDINVDCYTDSKDCSYVDLRVYAPGVCLPFTKNEFLFTVAVDLKDIDQNFVNSFCQYAYDFDPDEYPDVWIPHHGRDNPSNSIGELLDDSDTISEFLNNVSRDLQKALAKTKELKTPTEEDRDGLSLD